MYAIETWLIMHSIFVARPLQIHRFSKVMYHTKKMHRFCLSKKIINK